MTSDQCHDHNMHYLNVGETERWAEGVELYNPRLCCYSTDKPVKRGPVVSRTPLFLTPLSLSPGANPLYMPCSSAITMTQFLLKTVFPKLQKEPVLVQELSRETVPLSLTMRAAESYSRKCFVRNF